MALIVARFSPSIAILAETKDKWKKTMIHMQLPTSTSPLDKICCIFGEAGGLVTGVASSVRMLYDLGNPIPEKSPTAVVCFIRSLSVNDFFK